MTNTLIFRLLGFGFLFWGAEWLVRGAAKLARMIGVPPLAIGLTVVAYGTSSPELIVNIQSVLSGKADIALGNIVGSNIFNVLFVLGVCALVLPLVVESKLIRWDVPIMIFVSGLLYVFCLDHKLSGWEGWVFIAGAALYTWFCFVYSKKESKAVRDEYEKEFGNGNGDARQTGSLVQNIAFIVMGLVILVIGAKWLVDSSVALARYFGISELVIALTIIAAGPSLPEVATSVMAPLKRERDIAIGNVIGSCIFNILFIMGTSAVLSGQGLAINPNSMVRDIPFMIFAAVICYPILRSQSTISRMEGLLLFLLYIGYTVYLIQSNQ